MHRLQALGRDENRHLLAELGDEKGLLLQIDLAAAVPGRVVFGSTNAVTIPASDLGSLACYFTHSGHSRAMLLVIIEKIKAFVVNSRNMLDTLFIVAVIIFSAVIHEVMHGVAADMLGDKTARYAGRLTLNPIPHLDPFGSVILPALLAFSGSPFFFGWAKPVPYNPYNLKPGRFSEAIVAGAGPASNLGIALLFSAAIRLGVFPSEIAGILFIIVVVNCMLFLFNLIPIPPLDGSKVLEAFLPRGLVRGYEQWRFRLESNPFLGMGLVVLIIILLGGEFGNAVYSLAQAIAGI